EVNHPVFFIIAPPNFAPAPAEAKSNPISSVSIATSPTLLISEGSHWPLRYCTPLLPTACIPPAKNIPPPGTTAAAPATAPTAKYSSPCPKLFTFPFNACYLHSQDHLPLLRL